MIIIRVAWSLTWLYLWQRELISCLEGSTVCDVEGRKDWKNYLIVILLRSLNARLGNFPFTYGQWVAIFQGGFRLLRVVIDLFNVGIQKYFFWQTWWQWCPSMLPQEEAMEFFFSWNIHFMIQVWMSVPLAMNMLPVSKKKGRRCVFATMDLWAMGGPSVLVSSELPLSWAEELNQETRFSSVKVWCPWEKKKNKNVVIWFTYYYCKVLWTIISLYFKCLGRSVHLGFQVLSLTLEVIELESL